MANILNVKNEGGQWIGVPAIAGAPGPNLITPATATTLTGIIKGNGSTIEAATPGADYLNYDDIAGHSDSGSNPVLEGVFPGTELAHCILYGKSTQDGTPSPDAPVDIVDYAPEEVWVGGKNLYPIDDIPLGTSNGITLTRDGETFSFSGTPTDSTGVTSFLNSSAFNTREKVLKLFPKPGKYTISIDKNIDTPTGYVFVNLYVDGVSVARSFSAGGGSESKLTIDVLPEWHNAEDLRASIGFYSSNYATYPFSGLVCTVQLEYGDTATAHDIPYTPPTTYPLSDLPLPGIPVDEGGNYTDESGQQYIADTYDVATGEYVQRGRELVLDGTEAWGSSESWESEDSVSFNSNLVGDRLKGDSYGYGMMCDTLPVRRELITGAGKTGNGVSASFGGYYNMLDVILQKGILEQYGYVDGESTTRVTALKSYLAALYAAGTPVTIRYALAEPIVSYRTPQQLPAPAPYTQVMAGGGHIAATLGNAMAPVKTTPQTLSAEQIKQVFINLNIPVPTYEYSDRDLSKVFTADELHAKIAAQDFSGIRMGDYWPITLSGTAHDYATDTDFALNETHLLEFMPNFYAKSGNITTPPHILVCSRDLLSKTLQFRSADDVWYDTAATNPWLGSHLYQTINNPDNGIVKLVRQTDIGQYLHEGPSGKGMHDVIEIKAAGATTATRRTWEDRGLLFLPHEREIWGNGPFSEKMDGGYCLQWPTFAGSHKRIIKNRNGIRCRWWSCSSCAGSSADICIASYAGFADYVPVSNAGLSVPLCFLIT